MIRLAPTPLSQKLHKFLKKLPTLLWRERPRVLDCGL
jgi:hypothetical protein